MSSMKVPLLDHNQKVVGFVEIEEEFLNKVLTIPEPSGIGLTYHLRPIDNSIIAFQFVFPHDLPEAFNEGQGA